LKNDWGFDVQTVAPDSLDRARDVDLFAATSFYAPLIHKQVERLGKPLVVLTIHSRLQEAIRAGIGRGRLIVVAADSRFGDRVRASYTPDEPDRIRLVLARDHEGISRLDPEEPILLTRAARQILGSAPAPVIYPHSPTLSVETARALANIVVRTNLGSMK
jgi:hypothetical protein